MVHILLRMMLCGAVLVAACSPNQHASIQEDKPSALPRAEELPPPIDCIYPEGSASTELSINDLHFASHGFVHGRIKGVHLSFEDPVAWDVATGANTPVSSRECEDIRPVAVIDLTVIRSSNGEYSSGSDLRIYMATSRSRQREVFESMLNIGSWEEELAHFVSVGSEIAGFVHLDDDESRLAFLSTHESVYAVNEGVITRPRRASSSGYCPHHTRFSSDDAQAALDGVSIGSLFAQLAESREPNDSDAVDGYWHSTLEFGTHDTSAAFYPRCTPFLVEE